MEEGWERVKQPQDIWIAFSSVKPGFIQKKKKKDQAYFSLVKILHSFFLQYGNNCMEIKMNEMIQIEKIKGS